MFDYPYEPLALARSTNREMQSSETTGKALALQAPYNTKRLIWLQVDHDTNSHVLPIN